MSFLAFVTLLAVGLLGSFVSGMVGIGGSIVKYPLLLYVPPLLGVAQFTAHQVAGVSSIQVLFAAGAGMLAYRRGNYLHYRLIVTMGTAILIGSFVGAYTSKYLSESVINLVYACLASVAALMMFIPQRERAPQDSSHVAFNPFLAFSLAGIIGTLSGVVGAAGAFLLVPVMLVVLRIPTRVTIASSLAITFISSIGTSVGKLWTGDVLLGPALILIWASIVGAPLGAKLGKRMNTKWLRILLVALILGACIKIWASII